MGLVILLTSAGLCALLAWSLLRPIGNLREATRAMARGDLQARAVKVASRQDEVGQLGREFNHMAEQLQRLVDSQKRILADISHELRSPLARLQVAIGIAQQEGNEDSVHLLRIEQEAGRIDRMLEDVLTLARLDSGQQHLHWEIQSLEALLGQLCDDIRFEARAYGKELTVQYPGEIKVRVDIRLFLSALENVLRNALKYARARIGLTITASGNGLAIRILDDGPGVADDQLSRLFDPFYRVSSARNRETGGTGLGLAIAAGAIASQGGTIVASNRAEGGLCVAIHLASVQWDAD
nr:ATP-binding protein [Bowmanella dokdonensis]